MKKILLILIILAVAIGGYLYLKHQKATISSQRKHQSYEIAPDITVSSDSPGFNEEKAKQYYQEMQELISQGKYELIKVEEISGRRIYVYKFKLSDGEEITFGSAKPLGEITQIANLEYYKKWVGDWVVETVKDLSDGYLHIELDSSGVPAIELRFPAGVTKPQQVPKFQFVEKLNDGSLKYKAAGGDIPPEISFEFILNLNISTDKLELEARRYMKGEKAEEKKEILIRKNLWEELLIM